MFYLLEWEREMARRRMSKDEYETFAKRLAEKIKPGTIKGRPADKLPQNEEQHFYVCKQCGQAVDIRDLGEVFHDEVPGHPPLPEN